MDGFDFLAIFLFSVLIIFGGLGVVSWMKVQSSASKPRIDEE